MFRIEVEQEIKDIMDALLEISPEIQEDMQFLRPELNTLYQQRQLVREVHRLTENLVLSPNHAELRELIKLRLQDLQGVLQVFFRHLSAPAAKSVNPSHITAYSLNLIQELSVFHSEQGSGSSPVYEKFLQGINAFKKKHASDSAGVLIRRLVGVWVHEQVTKKLLLPQHMLAIQRMLGLSENGSPMDLDTEAQYLLKIFCEIWRVLRSQADILERLSPVLATSERMEDLVKTLDNPSQSSLAEMIATFTKPSGTQRFRRAMRSVLNTGGPARRFMDKVDSASIGGQEKVELKLEQAGICPLTKTLTRGAWQELAPRLFQNGSCGVLIIDIDKFKEVNDVLGHIQGDAILAGVASILKLSCRASDIVGRYGGEEFIVFMPRTTLADAQIVAERIRNHVQVGMQRVLSQYDPKRRLNRDTITVTIGLAVAPDHGRSFEIINKADQALLEGKRTGRNKVVLY